MKSVNMMRSFLRSEIRPRPYRPLPSLEVLRRNLRDMRPRPRDSFRRYAHRYLRRHAR